jgi:hypothetical protein
MVGATGLEPATPCTPCKCATRLRYAPTPKVLCYPLPFSLSRQNQKYRNGQARPKSSSKRSMSSSPRYVPFWTSMTTTSSRPTFSIRWTAPCGMSRESPPRIRISSPSSVTRAFPRMTCQCSARCRCLCRLNRFPGRTRNFLTLHPSSS